MKKKKASKPINILSTEKIETPDNPYYCLGCNSEYTEKNNDINSSYIEDYCRYLGYCHVKCWDKLKPWEQHEVTEIALLYGSTHKCEHKFYLKNLEGYH